MTMDRFPVGKKLFDRTIDLIGRSLDIRTSRHKVLSSNIANSGTSNYISKEIPFQKILDRSIGYASSLDLKRTHPGHFQMDLQTEVEMQSTGEEVNIDQEMAKLAENNLMFQAGVQALIKKLEALKATILEGGR